MATRRKNKQSKGYEENPIVLMGMALTAIVLAVSSAWHYWRIHRSILRQPGIARIFDLGLGKQLFGAIVLMGGLYGLAAFFLTDLSKSAEPLLVSMLWLCFIALGILLGWYLGKVVAIAFMGLVVDGSRQLLLLPPSALNIPLTGWLLVLPAIRHMTTIDEIPLADIEGISRERGTNLYLHGQMPSREMRFLHKLKRDEAIYLLQRASGGRIRLMRADYGL